MASQGTPLICLVDDSADYRLLLPQLLKRYCVPHSLAVFTGGISLLAALGRFKHLPDLILLDLRMPNLNGYQTVLRVKSQPLYRKIPVVMMSAEASADEIDACYEAGANSFCQKQVDVNEFMGELRDLCHYWLVVNQRPST